MRRTLRKLLAASALLAPGAVAQDNPVEVGAVHWGRDLEAALTASGETGKPVLVLFQEVPGCSGCQDFGRTVLSSPLLVEAIEDEFVPVLVFNNRGGADQQLLERFDEPAWNFQVIRFLDADGADIIPRKDRVWSLGASAARMAAALTAAGRPVPKYLQALALEHAEVPRREVAFRMDCFWTGEKQLGRLDGVLSTEAGFLEGHEVTRVVYDPAVLSLEALTTAARESCAATEVHAPIGDGYRRAPESDQCRQLGHRPAVLAVPGLTELQRTRVNALAPVSEAQMLAWLSPRQRRALSDAEARTDPDDE